MARTHTLIASSLIVLALSTSALAQRSTPVTVVNPEDDPVPVTVVEGSTLYPRELFHLRLDSSAGESRTYTVPEDKTLVIEQISVWAYGIDCEDLSFLRFDIVEPGIDYSNGPGVYPMIIPLVDIANCNSLGEQSMGATLSTRVYAGPSWKVRLDHPYHSTSSVITYGGYLLPAGSPSLAP